MEDQDVETPQSSNPVSHEDEKDKNGVENAENIIDTNQATPDTIETSPQIDTKQSDVEINSFPTPGDVEFSDTPHEPESTTAGPSPDDITRNIPVEEVSKDSHENGIINSSIPNPEPTEVEEKSMETKNDNVNTGEAEIRNSSSMREEMEQHATNEKKILTTESTENEQEKETSNNEHEGGSKANSVASTENSKRSNSSLKYDNEDDSKKIEDLKKIRRRTMVKIKLAIKSIKAFGGTPVANLTSFSANYGTSFAIPQNAGSNNKDRPNELTPSAQLPANIHLANRPSVASVHVMGPESRNTLSGRKFDVSSQAFANSQTPNPLTFVPSGTAVPKRRPSITLWNDDTNNEAEINLDVEMSSMHRGEPSRTPRRNRSRHGSLIESTIYETAVIDIQPAVAQKRPIIRNLPNDVEDDAKSDVPVFHSHKEIDNSIPDDLQAEVEKKLLDFHELVHERDLPINNIIKQSMIPRPVVKPRILDIVTVSLKDLVPDNNIVNDVQDEVLEVNKTNGVDIPVEPAENHEDDKPEEATKNAVVKSKRKKKAKIKENHIENKGTFVSVLTKKGIELEGNSKR
jgi:hypothetical protein